MSAGLKNIHQYVNEQSKEENPMKWELEEE
jgi:hypothetical protein